MKKIKKHNKKGVYCIPFRVNIFLLVFFLEKEVEDIQKTGFEKATKSKTHAGIETIFENMSRWLFQISFYFDPYLGEDEPNLTWAYFVRWLGSTTN